MVVKVGLTLALAFALALLVLLFVFDDHISSAPEVPCEPIVLQNLKGSAGDGQATLTWGAPADSLLRVKSWWYEQSQGNTRTTHGTGATSTSHVVLGLTNGVAYFFRVRAILESDLKGCWSNAVGVTPTQPANVMEAIEKHQREIVANTSTIAAEAVAGGVLAKELGARGVGALEALAGSASTMAEESTMLRNDLSKNFDDLSENVRNAGEAVATGLARIEVNLEKNFDDPSENVGQAGNAVAADLAGIEASLEKSFDDLSEKVEQAGEAVVVGLAGIEAKLESREPPVAQLCDGENVGRFYFDRGSYSLAGDEDSWDTIRPTVERLQRLAKDRLVLVVGYASAVGFATYNLHLSEMRALCTVRCLRDGLDGQRLVFREIAKGEALEESSRRGDGRGSRRVDVIVCGENMTEPLSPSDARTEFESETVDCGCPTHEVPLATRVAPR